MLDLTPLAIAVAALRRPLRGAESTEDAEESESEDEEMDEDRLRDMASRVRVSRREGAKEKLEDAQAGGVRIHWSHLS